MKLADFLSDKSKQALNDIRKYYSEESIDKRDYAAESNDDEQSKGIAKPTRKVDRRIEWQAKKKKKAERRQRLKERNRSIYIS